VLVTGGAGFIGSHIAEETIQRGHEVAVLDNLSSGKRHQVPRAARFFELDIRRDVEPAFAEFRPEAVVHQAAQVSVSFSMKEPAFDAEVNVLGSLRVIDACRRHGTRKVVYASSAAAYGDLQTLPLREEMRPRPVSCYGVSKYTVEHYLRSAGRDWGLEWVALRYSNVYGPRQDPHGEGGVLAIFSEQLLKGQRPTIFGGGELTRDYVFVEDIARANALVLDADLREHPDPVFNASTGKSTSTNRIFRLLKEALGSTLEPIAGPWRRGDVQDSVLDSSKLRAAVGWELRVTLEEGVRRTAEFFRGTE
jgi:UDP-glucose 4-epimerase